MTSSDPPPEHALTRRALRDGSSSPGTDTGAGVALAERSPDVLEREDGSSSRGGRALAWVSEDSVGRLTETQPPEPARPLVERWPRRSPWRPGVLLPIATTTAVIAAYVVTMLLWPLASVAPTVETFAVESAAAPASDPAWPEAGAAAAAATGLGPTVSSSDAVVPMASITKLVTALVVLDELPLDEGETGPSFSFDAAERQSYWDYLAAGESALPFPETASLTQVQLMQGMLVGSAGNYADYLAGLVYPTEEAYALAATQWLTTHGLVDIEVVDPSGISPANTATPAAAVSLGQRALAEPVIAEIVAAAEVQLPEVGTVENTNILLDEPGVVGVKTGSLFEDYNLLAAQEVAVGDTVVQTVVAVLGQPDSESRFDAARAVLAELSTQVQPTVAVPAGTVVGRISTRWGAPVDVVTGEDASVVLWNGGTASATPTVALQDERDEGDTAGSLRVAGPADSAQVDAVLAEPVADPSPWWRLTHPLELLGLAG
ncbi:D-alanyl-D-alanine carboxypeptidase [Microbacterium sp. LRZ72]|uniref:D-alanyl-D-alanine carboxypeptidase n=1 Tax=Microbacterium sp. LRZ72 TaxID=2942481 RepID=UPI0029AEB515|nr:D-alanyl-D-alanine carboxypeptidase [Microbacterium sp. LRZ72]MDX2376434.1 D-alanyl-D-alanine carboxypeptidase [Microbacterium sp. LRZ72]